MSAARSRRCSRCEVSRHEDCLRKNLQVRSLVTTYGSGMMDRQCRRLAVLTLLAGPLVLPAQQVLVATRQVHVPSKLFQPSREVDVWVPANEGITAPRFPVLVF